MDIIHLAIDGVLLASVSFALGYYVRGRGFVGVQSDILDIKTDVTNLVAKIESIVNAQKATA